MSEPRAFVQEIDGQAVLVDPDAMDVMRAVGKHNCINTLAMNADRVEDFKERVAIRDLAISEVVIVVLNVNDSNGAAIADALMPDHDWQAIRDRGEIPFARGLAGRAGIQGVLDLFDTQAAEKLRAMTGLAVVVVDHGTAEVFPGT